jgi:hypothetical protein
MSMHMAVTVHQCGSEAIIAWHGKGDGGGFIRGSKARRGGRKGRGGAGAQGRGS